MDFLSPLLQCYRLRGREDVTENEVAVFGKEGVLGGSDCICHREMESGMGASWCW